uniref:Uncharacterized protein n=1 Tax=Utricularia reniformis TaxID=192314 RepID=A0A1Y0B3L6_9LAMI|nr:hypothetical protein AEK19_MT0833 [Utricularia reniformis]YP_009382304.1 hypothetical protein AEK19_MT1876 [Utricularia reniformis]ART31066.1 hypothetical protein AEK19_MT0833 [Utricularia reniformis]ART32045.1 hypothetical protein AEK19_MT1876 [Utricularia reniformis]
MTLVSGIPFSGIPIFSFRLLFLSELFLSITCLFRSYESNLSIRMLLVASSPFISFTLELRARVKS